MKGTSDAEIGKRTGRGKQTIRQFTLCASEQGIRKDTKIRIYKTIVENIVTYVLKCVEQAKQRPKSMEMGFWRRCSGLTHINETNREQKIVDPSIIDTVEAKSLR